MLGIGLSLWQYSSGDDALLVTKSTTAVSVTNTTTETVVATYSAPVGYIGANGVLRFDLAGSMTNSANAKNWRIRYGGVAGTVMVAFSSQTTVATFSGQAIICNRTASTQFSKFISNRGTDALQVAVVTTGLAVDTSVALDIVITAQMAALAETMTLEGFTIEKL